MKTQKKYAIGATIHCCLKNWFSHFLTAADLKCYLNKDDIPDDLQIKHSIIAFSQRYKNLFKYPLVQHSLKDIIIWAIFFESRISHLSRCW